ncbi:MAG: insulinase family protein [Oscillospiraceae bacterium]|nr:insulinase family protein [Oscillospiraceae bacterium]
MYERITLPNGVRIVYERIPYVRSVALGIWVGTGSRCEKGSENGAAHYIEHMSFKGTSRFSAAELASLMDGIGGQTNAFTTREMTCFYGKALDSHLGQLSEILCDMFFDSLFRDEDVRSERGVIFEEIDMYEDTPDDLAAERLVAAIYRGSSLARPILGRKYTLEKMDGRFLKSFMEENYRSASTVVALSGSFEDSDIEYLARRFSAMPKKRVRRLKTVEYSPAFTVKKKKIEQNHICMGFPGISFSDDRRYTAQLMVNILGGGMSSRLFQLVREQRGLCYSIDSFAGSYSDTGCTVIEFAASPESEDEALRLIIDEVKRFRDEGVSGSELDRVREQLKANTIMGLEQTSSRLMRLGRGELCMGYVQDVDDMVAEYDAVTVDDVRKLAGELLDLERLSFSAVGRVRSTEEYMEKLS